jgi:hypothetical protein
MTQSPAVPPTDPASPEGALSEGATFEIVGGAATAEEIAALAAVLAAMAAAASERDAALARGPVRVSGWAERSRLVRRPLAHSPGGWRASARPH